MFNGDTLLATVDQQLASGVATGTAKTGYVHPDHLGGEHDCQDAIGLRRLGPDRASRTRTGVVQVDLPEGLLSAMNEAAEIVRAVRIVVRIEFLECTHAL